MCGSYIKYLIKFNITVGLFNASNELVARCLQLDNGSLALYHVDEKHEDKGYGEIVVKEIARRVAIEQDIDVAVNVTASHEKVVKVFENVGFKDLETTYWVGVSGKSTKKLRFGVPSIVYIKRNKT
jgi:hypothetical protein